jgi:hypothetical protein
LQIALKTRTYKPSPVNRTWIDKPGKPDKRPLGIPTMRDRVVQEVLRMLMEPVWESDFLDCSHGFRPKRRTMDCIYTIYSRVHTVNKYFIAIEGDIRKCFDRINHDILLKLVRRWRVYSQQEKLPIRCGTAYGANGKIVVTRYALRSLHYSTNIKRTLSISMQHCK